jgi:Protein of unknown function (DUF3800)
VWLVFLDESEQLDPSSGGLGPLLAVGCVLIPEDAVAAYAADLTAIRAQLNIPPADELKWKPAKGSFLESAGGEVVGTLRRRMLRAAIERDVRSVVVVWDHSRVWQTKEKDEVYRELLKYLYERIEKCLRRHNAVGVVIADKPSGGRISDDTRWLTEALRLTNDGTEYVTPERVVLPIVTAHSHLVPHLQLADLVVAATTAAVAGRPNAQPLVPLLRQLAHDDRRGIVSDVGIKLWPPELKNLYYWVFEETRYPEATWDRGFELPDPTLPYARDDGLPTTDGSRRG